jgi:hypothetical protein
MFRVEEILREADERLAVTRSGFAMMSAGQGEARIGLRNVAVFGCMVTFATNNLRSVVDGFEVWDVDMKAKHFGAPECKYMYELRNVIEKQARTPVSMSAHISSFNTNDINRFPRPSGATSFFIGDQNGGSGWMVPDGKGNETAYYVALPSDIGSVWLNLPEFEGRNATEVAGIYLGSLESYLVDVRVFTAQGGA